MGRIAGRYTANRDGRTYGFDATWQEAGEGVIWSATVKRDRALVGTPTGQIRHIAGVNIAHEVRRRVEVAIEAIAAK
jgi:hypothetical protein